MTRLMLLLFSIAATVLMGVFIVAVLTLGYGTLKPIVLAAAAGFVLAIPASWIVARQMVG